MYSILENLPAQESTSQPILQLQKITFMFIKHVNEKS